MGRKLRTVNDAMKPTKKKGQKEDISNGTETFVYVRDYRPDKEAWTKGTIIGQEGRVIFKVVVEGER